VTVTLDPGTTLAATQALTSRRGQTWTDEQVAYLIALAYHNGLTDGHDHRTAELLATWAEHPAEPQPTRQDRIAAEVAAGGPALFTGGLPKPADYFPADPDRVPPRFPRLDEQTWLTADDVAFCRSHAAGAR
jgi:hypothetical protein